MVQLNHVSLSTGRDVGSHKYVFIVVYGSKCAAKGIDMVHSSCLQFIKIIILCL